ncbi:MAG: AmmeMemoRadiSam system protein B [Woeseia sp.]
MAVIREAAVAGQFYPGRAGDLAAAVERYLSEAAAEAGPLPKALIVPHAGYVYSGPVAATAYARLRPYREQITRVILLGPCHRVPVRGLASSGADAFRTPLGDVPIDKNALAGLELPAVKVFDHAHAFEHSLEVHLPFLQTILDEFTLVPLVVGDASPATVADVLEALWGGPGTLIVISSDLSHYLDYKAAKRQDKATCEAIERFDVNNVGPDDACGCHPIGGLLELARRRGMSVETLDLRNSGETAGPMGQVVGYGSWMFME